MLESNRKLFDFSPFKSHHRKHVPVRAEPGFDPLFDAQKRVVPTGPNPLHH
ncbi:CLAVATA3/ESR [Bienertia sinuspersici]